MPTPRLRALALLLVAATARAQELRAAIVVDPGDLARPAVCPVLATVSFEDLSPPPDVAAAPAWEARVEGGGASRVAQLRPTHGAEGEPSGLELAWHEYGLEAGVPAERELVLSPVRDRGRADRYALIEREGARELREQDRALWRHELVWDPARHAETFRPYTHLIEPWSGTLLTKGPGGRYPHHRGVFCGWTRVRAGGATHNFWSIPGEPRPHQEHRGWDEAAEWIGPVLARVAARIDWVSGAGEVVVREHRAWDTWPTDDGRALLLDYTVTLVAGGDVPVELDGDPAHAGFQVRLARSVAEAEACRYVLPASATGGAGDNWSDAPWVAARFPIGEGRFEVLFHDHPANPRPTVFNTRGYGRFGPFFRATLVPGEPLVLRYALRIRAIDPDEPEDREALAAEHAAWVAPVRVRLR